MSAPIYTRVRSTIIKTLLVFAQGELKRPKKLEQVKNISDDISGIIDDVSDDISDVSDGITYGVTWWCWWCQYFCQNYENPPLPSN